MDEEGLASIGPAGWAPGVAVVAGRVWMPPGYVVIDTSGEGRMVMTLGATSGGGVPSLGSALPLGPGAMLPIDFTAGAGVS